MKKIAVGLNFLFIGLFSLAVFGQNLEKYIELKAEKYQEAEGEYVGVSPAVKENVTDEIGKFMATYPRRFRYLLANNNSFQGLDRFYPDVLKMNQLYLDKVKADNKFVSHFQKLITPINKKSFRRDTYTKKELMKVASRFFFCDSVKADKSIGSHICIALNGLKEAQFDKDYTILEAFCFEAIFEAIEAKAPARTKVVENFLNYIEEVSKKEKLSATANESYLQNVRLKVFEKMTSDIELENILLQYFQKNKANLSFEISS